jgi:hypothetical protein
MIKISTQISNIFAMWFTNKYANYKRTPILTTKNQKTMKFPVIASLAVGLLAGVVAKAQTADEIVNKHIAAIGGKEKISSIKSVYIEADMEVMGNNAPSVTYIVNGKGFRNDVEFNGQKITRVVTDKGGWALNPMMGQTAAEAMPADQAKAEAGQIFVGGPLFDYAAKGTKVELVGKEDVNGVSAHKLKVTTKEGTESTYYIDPTTFYVVKVVNKISMNGEQIETSAVFSKYTKTEYGFVMPATTELTLPQGFTLNVNNKKVEINKEIDPKLFDMPK